MRQMIHLRGTYVVYLYSINVNSGMILTEVLSRTIGRTDSGREGRTVGRKEFVTLALKLVRH